LIFVNFSFKEIIDRKVKIADVAFFISGVITVLATKKKDN